jgi:hypothetical protein
MSSFIGRIGTGTVHGGNDIVVGIVVMIVMSEMSEGVIGLSINRNAGGSHGQRAQQQ